MTSVEDERDLSGTRQRGVDSAAQVFDRLIEQVEELGRARPRPDRGLDDLDGGTGPAAGIPQVRAAAAAAIDMYAELFQRTFELYADLVESTAGPDGPTPSADRPTVHLAGSPDTCAETTVWAHNTTDAPAGGLTLRLTDLTAHDGTVIRAAASSFAPGRLTIDPGNSASSWLSLAIPADAPEGVYYGYVLATGLPEANAPIRLVVSR
jgi:hypothetical protein